MLTFDDEKFTSSDEENYDSDRIESDVEAELYSVVHHEVDTSTLISDTSCSSSPNKNIISAENSLQSTKFNTLLNFIRDNKFDKSNSANKDNHCHYYEEDINSSYLDIKNDTLNCKLYTSFENSESYREKLSNMSAKRKSEISEHSDNVPSPNKIQKISNAKINNFQKFVSHDQVSSDNESDIICIGTENKQNNLQTNLSEKVISISSDSYLSDSDSDTWCYSFSKNSASNLNQNKIKDHWFINDDDKYCSRRNSGRYHESKILSCHNCHQRGHLAKNCQLFKVPKCFLCGDRHRPVNCKNRICVKCYRFGHDGRYCQGELVYCSICQMPGHQEQICPDIWRRYNLTTTKKFIKPKKYSYSSPLYCYNCGRPGHFGGECMQRRMIGNYFPTWPCVINFKRKEEYEKRRLQKKKNTRQIFNDETEKRANPITDENPLLQKPDSFVDRFLRDKAQAIEESKMRRRRKQKLKRLLKKADSELSKKEKAFLSQESGASEITSKKIETAPMETQNFPRTPKKNSNSYQGSKVNEIPNTEAVQTETPHFPRTPKKNSNSSLELNVSETQNHNNLNSSLELEASETQNQSGKKTLNKKDRRARNQRKKMKRKAAKLNRLLDQETNQEAVKNLKKFMNQVNNRRPLIVKL